MAIKSADSARDVEDAVPYEMNAGLVRLRAAEAVGPYEGCGADFMPALPAG